MAITRAMSKQKRKRNAIEIKNFVEENENVMVIHSEKHKQRGKDAQKTKNAGSYITTKQNEFYKKTNNFAKNCLDKQETEIIYKKKKSRTYQKMKLYLP